MNDPNPSQHYIGKLLKYLGPDNIVWGTDCILTRQPADADHDVPELHDHPAVPGHVRLSRPSRPT